MYYNTSKNFDDRMSLRKEKCFANRSEAPGQDVQYRDGSLKRYQKRKSPERNEHLSSLSSPELTSLESTCACRPLFGYTHILTKMTLLHVI
jgi:hypothetical protein